MMSNRLVTRGVLSAHLRWFVYLLTAYPVVDYALHIHPFSILGDVWEKLILVCLCAFAYLNRPWKPLDSTKRMIVFVMLLGLGFLLMHIGDSTVSFAGYRDDYLYMLFPLFLPYVLDKEDLVPMIKWVVLIGFLIAIHGIYEYLVKIPDPASWADPLQHERTRVYSIFGSPNILGSYMAFIVPLAAGVALYERSRAERWFYAFAAAVSLMTLLFTFTRGAWVAFFVGTLVFTWLWDRRLTVGVIILALFAIFFVHPIHARVMELVSPVYLSKSIGNGRIARWINAYDQMRTSPLFGVGLGHYGGAVASRYFNVSYVDNYYAKTLAETGLVGLAALLALYFTYVRDVWRVWKQTVDQRMKFLLAGIVSSLVVLVVHNGMENVFEEPAMYVLFWLVGSCAIIYGQDEVQHA